MNIQIIAESVSREALKKIAENQFLDMVKAVVDIEKGIMCIGGELHADVEALLIEQGSQQRDLWGINLYPGNEGEDFVEFDSMINLRPSQKNMSRGVDDPDIRKNIIAVVNGLVK